MPFPLTRKRMVYLAPFSKHQHNNWRGVWVLRTYEAIPHTPNLLKALLLRPRNCLLNNRVHILKCMRIIAARALLQPLHEVKARRSIKLQLITVKEIRDDGVVPVCCELVGHQLGVLPDPNNVGEVDDCGVFVDGLAFRFGDVGFDNADFDALARWLAAVTIINIFPILDPIDVELKGRQKWWRGTYSCLTPTVQHCAGGLEAILD